MRAQWRLWEHANAMTDFMAMHVSTIIVHIQATTKSVLETATVMLPLVDATAMLVSMAKTVDTKNVLNIMAAHVI